jgi:uncharacterized protein YjbI with pentapeptide repeats
MLFNFLKGGEKMPSKMKEENRKCKYAWGDYKCSRPVLPGDEYCIFHSKDIEVKKDKFAKAWEGEFESQKKDEKKYDFTGFVFPKDFSFIGIEFKKAVIFDHAQFSGVTDFMDVKFSRIATFNDTKFSGKTRFKKTKFIGMVSFEKTQFLEEVDFRDAQFPKWINFMNCRFMVAHFDKVEFPGEAHFAGAKFLRDALFWSVVFSGLTIFDKAQFYGMAAFGKVEFIKEALFNDAQFSQFPGEAVFEFVQFHMSVSFINTEFSGEAHFSKAQFPGLAYFRNAKFFGKTFFKETQFSGKTDFGGAQFFGKVDFLNSKFQGEELKGLSEALRNRGLKMIFKGKYKLKDFRFHLNGPIAKKYPVIERMIKDAWYLDDFKKNNRITYWIWWLSSDCGRSFFRWALLSILLAVFFAYNFFSLGPEAFEIRNLKFSFETMLYYSVVTFTTLGFGDVIPNTIEASRWVMAEVIAGYIMLGGLISIFANKLARRS